MSCVCYHAACMLLGLSHKILVNSCHAHMLIRSCKANLATCSKLGLLMAANTTKYVQDQEKYDILPEPDDDENDMLDLAFALTDT